MEIYRVLAATRITDIKVLGHHGSRHDALKAMGVYVEKNKGGTLHVWVDMVTSVDGRLRVSIIDTHRADRNGHD